MYVLEATVIGLLNTGVLTFERMKQVYRWYYKKGNEPQLLPKITEFAQPTNLTHLIFKGYAQELNVNETTYRNSKSVSYQQVSKRTFQGIDEKLDMLDMKKIQEGLESLTVLLHRYPDDVEILWRIGKAHHNIAVGIADVSKKQIHIAQGLQVCQIALDVDPDTYEAHKWYGLLIGYRTCFDSVKEKIADGHSFKVHLDAALALNPNDATLHHMLGRFAYDVASLKWYVRELSATLFGEIPHQTFEDALVHFLQAEKLTDGDWKENKMFIARCQIALGKHGEALDILLEADKYEQKNLNNAVNEELKALLQKYKKYEKT